MIKIPESKRILVLQLTRFGDIFLSLPALKALRRAHPTAQIDLMVRRRFQEATIFSDSVNSVIPWDTQHLLEPYLTDLDKGLEETVSRLKNFFKFLKSQNYTQVINLSFSPMSSYVTYALTNTSQTSVLGYTRQPDGYLAIPDEVSSYFHAQVNVDTANRIHLADIFSAIGGVSLEAEDWNILGAREYLRKGVAIHLGASQKQKTLSSQKWYSVLNAIVKRGIAPVTLVGSADEREMAEEISQRVDHPAVLNKVGQTSFNELVHILSTSHLLVGGDSSPMHLASLTQTKVLNLSLLPVVKFWESGPRAPGSRVLCLQDEADVGSDQIAEEVEWIINNANSTVCQWIVPTASGAYGYVATNEQEPIDYAWELTQAIYFGSSFPKCPTTHIEQALFQMLDLCTLAIENTPLAADPNKPAIPHILERIDETIAAIVTVAPELRPLISWYQTEKIRQGPMTIENLIVDTLRVLNRFNDLILAALMAERSMGEEAVDQLLDKTAT